MLGTLVVFFWMMQVFSGAVYTTVESSILGFELTLNFGPVWIWLGLAFFYAHCFARIVRRTGLKKNLWQAYVPILDVFLMLRVAKRPAWWWVLIPLILPFVLCWASILEDMQKPRWLVVLLLIPPFNLFFVPYLAFSAYELPADES